MRSTSCGDSSRYCRQHNNGPFHGRVKLAEILKCSNCVKGEAVTVAIHQSVSRKEVSIAVRQYEVTSNGVLKVNILIEDPLDSVADVDV